MNKKGIHKLLALALALALAVTVLPGAALAQETADTGAQDTQAAVWDEGQPAPDGEELTQDGALEEEPPHRVRVLDTGYDEQARIEALMENIALGYAESSSDAWHVMGVAAYADRYGSEYAQSAQTKLAHLDTVVDDVQGDYASDATFASAVVSLRAVGYDAADILDRDGAALDITALLTAAASSGPDGDAFRLVAYQQDDIASPAQVSQTVSSAVSSQNENGSWNSWGFESADTTAMMLAALAPYTAEAGVSDAMADAVAYLDSVQGENGGVMSWGSENANSTAMAIIGLKAAGIDPVTDVRFVTDGNSLLDGLLAFATAEDDGFGYTDQVFNDFATKQAFLALIASQSADVTDNVLDFSGHAVAQGAATQNPPDPGDDDDDNGGDDSDDAITVDFVLMDVPHAFSDSIDVPEGTSVRTVFTRAMSAHSVPYTISGGYVVEIDGLAEFDGGPNAGWMYLVNGAHPGVGIGSCVVHDGDEVAFHYSGDYTEEDDSWDGDDSSPASSSSGGGAQREAHERVRETGLGQLAPARSCRSRSRSLRGAFSAPFQRACLQRWKTGTAARFRLTPGPGRCALTPRPCARSLRWQTAVI
jgi:hypothetical protein